MSWLPRVLAGPAIWAATFALVYALHGAGCALGWPGAATPFGSLHRLAMGLGWAVGLAAGAALLAALPRGPGRAERLPRLGAWIGFGATFFTLFPLLAATSCG